VGLSALICILFACSDDPDPAPQTTSPTGRAEVVDASVRQLRGDGTEPTPESDIESRQRTPIGPQGLAEVVDEYLNGGAGGQSGSDAGSSTGGTSAGGASGDPADAGTD
jgi:hypothetical protein